MKATVNKKRMIALISERTQFNQAEVREMFEAFEEILFELLTLRIDVSLNGLFKVVYSKIKPRRNWNNWDKRFEDLPETYRIAFSPSPLMTRSLRTGNIIRTKKDNWAKVNNSK